MQVKVVLDCVAVEAGVSAALHDGDSGGPDGNSRSSVAATVTRRENHVGTNQCAATTIHINFGRETAHVRNE
jgi:hypothetical protein